MKVLYVKTFGCKVNQYNAETMLQSLYLYYKIVDRIEDAHIVIMNACVVTEKAERECVSVKKAYKNQNQKIYIMGLYRTYSPGICESLSYSYWSV